MQNYELTKVFRFNDKQLVVAETIEEAISLFQDYYVKGSGYASSRNSCVKSVELVFGDGAHLIDNAIIRPRERG